MTPTFDPITQTWFLEDGREAPSLRSLAARTGRKLEGYYPNGVPLDVIKKHMDEQAALLGTNAPQPQCAIPVHHQSEDGGILSEWRGGGLPAAEIGKPTPIYNPPVRNGHGRPRTYNWEAVIKDRKNGLTYQEIADKHNMKNASSVAGIVNAYNKRQRAAGRPLA